MLKTSNMQSPIISNRFIIGIVAFGVSFGLSLVLSWDFNKAFFTGLITVPATYLAALFVDKRRRNYEMLILDSLYKRIRDLEGLKSRMVVEINQLEARHSFLYKESNLLHNQIMERRSQRDCLNRELGTFVIEKKQLEAEITSLQKEIINQEKNKVELDNTCSSLLTEKRRLELNCHLSHAEITQLQIQISELQAQKEELESNVILLNRLKPQLEKKLHEMRCQVHELEIQETQQNKLIVHKTAERETIEATINSLQNKTIEQQQQVQQLQAQLELLQQERDQLQSQVWELLQQSENLNQEPLDTNTQDTEIDIFPFSDLIETIETTDKATEKPENVSQEWLQFLHQLPNPEIQTLKAIIEHDNPRAVIKKIAEENITMPNLLIDSINEQAKNTIGELIIDSSSDIPEIYPEYLTNVNHIIAMYQNTMSKQTTSI
jgi:chromosome segregation ATPase